MSSVASIETPPAEVEAAFDEVAGFLNSQTGRLVELAEWLLAEGNEVHWSGVGLESPEKYLAWRIGVSIEHAKRIVAIAARACELPVTVGALKSGELSEDQVWPIVRSAPAWADEQSASYARRMTVTQIRRIMRTYPFEAHETADEREQRESVEPDGDVDGSAAEPADADGADEVTTPANSVPDDWCWYGRTDDGRWQLRLETDLDTGKVIEASLDEARDRLFQAGHADVTSIDAVRALAEQSLDRVTSPQRRDRYRVALFVDASDGRVTDDLGGVVPDHVAAQICCDGIVNPILLEHGLPVSVGRSQRIVPDRTRRIVLHRDGGCRMPGCGAQHHLEIHHIVHWSDDGPTDSWNLVALCPRHHRLHHRGHLGIAGNADELDGLTFTDVNGRVIPASGARPRPPDAPPPPIDGTWRHPLGERLDPHWFSYFRPGVDDAHLRRARAPG